jgi:hypothetical protein
LLVPENALEMVNVTGTVVSANAEMDGHHHTVNSAHAIPPATRREESVLGMMPNRRKFVNASLAGVGLSVTNSYAQLFRVKVCAVANTVVNA